MPRCAQIRLDLSISPRLPFVPWFQIAVSAENIHPSPHFNEVPVSVIRICTGTHWHSRLNLSRFAAPVGLERGFAASSTSSVSGSLAGSMGLQAVPGLEELRV